MRYTKVVWSVLASIILASIVVGGLFVFANVQDVVYVSSYARIGGPGFSWWPKKSLEEALQKHKKTIFVSGVFERSYVIGGGITVIGTNNGTQIRGDIAMKDDAIIQKMSVQGDIDMTSGAKLYESTVHGNVNMASGTELYDSTIRGDAIVRGDVTMKDSTITYGARCLTVGDSSRVRLDHMNINACAKNALFLKQNSYVTIDDSNIIESKRGIYTEKNVEIILRNSHVTDHEKNGIDLEENASLTISGSAIDRNNKGLYVRRYSVIEIKNSFVQNNREEGVDVRAYVDATLTDNVITNNAESGIEYIIGGSHARISGNDLRYNQSSGIALQFYAIAPELGIMDISRNNLSYNKSYGVRCANPQGGKPSGGYYGKSITTQDNVMEKNGISSFSKKCKVRNEISVVIHE